MSFFKPPRPPEPEEWLPPVPGPQTKPRGDLPEEEVRELIKRSLRPHLETGIDIAVEGVLDLLGPDSAELRISRSQFDILAQELCCIAEDGGTQPAYRRGMYRALSAVQKVLVKQWPPKIAARDSSPVYGYRKGEGR